MSIKLYDSELKIMSVVWENENIAASTIAQQMKEMVGWSKTTTYTLIGRCIAKGAIERLDPHFICRALIPKEEVCDFETAELLNKLFDGVPDQLIASLLGRKKKMTPQKLDEILKMINDLE